jgi:hypothetical protein
MEDDNSNHDSMKAKHSRQRSIFKLFFLVYQFEQRHLLMKLHCICDTPHNHSHQIKMLCNYL